MTRAAADCGFGIGDLDGQTLTVRAGRATITNAQGPPFTGSVDRQGGAFRVTTVGPGSPYHLDLTGTVDAAGNLTGTSALSARLGETGIACNFPFTGHPGSATATATTRPPMVTVPPTTSAAAGPPCTRDALQAALANGTITPANHNFACHDGWAYVRGAVDANRDEFNALFRASGNTWTVAGNCDDPAIPPDIHEGACTTS